MTDTGNHHAVPRGQYSDYVGFALWFYRKKQFPLYQIVWPNDEGPCPFDPQASRAFKEWQAVLGEDRRNSA
jgi:hypothetical protein